MRVLHYPAEKRPAFLVARLRRQPTFLTPIERRHVGHWTEQRAERPGRLVAPGLALVAEAPAPPAAWFDPYDWLVEWVARCEQRGHRRKSRPRRQTALGTTSALMSQDASESRCGVHVSVRRHPGPNRSPAHT